MATNKPKRKQQVQEEELSITCGKDLVLIAPHRLVLEGKITVFEEIRLTRGSTVSIP